MTFSAKFQEINVGVFVIYPSGDLDTHASEAFKEKLNFLLQNAARVLIFDLKDLDYICSAGLQVLFSGKKAMNARGGKVIFANLKPQIKKVFEIINVLPSLTIFESKAQLDDYLIKIQQKIANSEDRP
jgi:anti-anti-sigma factor